MEGSQHLMHDILYSDKSIFKYLATKNLSWVSKIKYWTFLAFWTAEYWFLAYLFLIENHIFTSLSIRRYLYSQINCTSDFSLLELLNFLLYFLDLLMFKHKFHLSCSWWQLLNLVMKKLSRKYTAFRRFDLFIFLLKEGQSLCIVHNKSRVNYWVRDYQFVNFIRAHNLNWHQSFYQLDEMKTLWI